jgi:hypothetical protein
MPQARLLTAASFVLIVTAAAAAIVPARRAAAVDPSKPYGPSRAPVPSATSALSGFDLILCSSASRLCGEHPIPKPA